MAYDHEEQEQLENIKAWWRSYGSLVTWVLIIVLAAYAGWAGWQSYQRNQAAKAAHLYEEFEQAIAAQDKDKVLRAATDMEDKFSGTAYAQMAALGAAKAAYEASDRNHAKLQLQWVIDHGKDEAYKAIAKVRLAGILLDEKAYDAGLQLLDGEFPQAFSAMVDDRKGDILAAQNKLDQARTAYQNALNKTEARDPARQLIQIKLDAIGGGAQKAA
jgi:predicted negative regulator of RcsB-dependent stress response